MRISTRGLLGGSPPCFMGWRRCIKNTNGKLAFLDLQFSIEKRRKIFCEWYQRPTDTGIKLNFRSCAPLQYKRSVIERTVHRVFRSASTWEEYDEAMKINREQWLDNQYPESWLSRVASHALEKIIREGKSKQNMAEKKKSCDYSSDSPPILMVQYRGKYSQTLAKKRARYHQCADKFHDEENENLHALSKILFFQ